MKKNKPSKQTIDLNPQFQYAYEIMENSDKNVFVTGRAGTGKSTLLKYFRENTKKKIVVLAPTGVASININGQTIHSFFRFKPGITRDNLEKISGAKAEIYKKLDAIVIDEISMVRADLLDCIDIFMRKNGRDKRRPFGGTQMIFIGDLYQLPPVVTSFEKKMFEEYYKSPYFFSADVFQVHQDAMFEENEKFSMLFIELEKIYRQSDDVFISLLNSIRNNTINDENILHLNTRYNKSFEDKKNLYIILTTTNAMADDTNSQELQKLSGKEHIFYGQIRGKFDEKFLPTERELHVKKGAHIMLLNNDSLGRWVNGTLAVVNDIVFDEESEQKVVEIVLENGEIEHVTPYNWDMYSFQYNKETRSISSNVVGSFSQYPFRLAWAVTIHKSQGKTFDKVVVDIGRGTFSSGQLYVALSRCTSFEGLVLKKMIEKKHVWTDWNVVKFVTSYQYKQANELFSVDEKIAFIKDAILQGKKIAIIYLKSDDSKSRRILVPYVIGEMEFRGKKYIGLEAYCEMRKDNRVFNIDRILELKNVD
ncbi:MAG: AAA family ATPase [Candidatus Magasanikbacteria bacterium CG_4_10_14_0_8_um_filter_32_14]|uniref:AAA family ATPase n=1 Tax=Candidatus Magasanikbacteria bacterium CG_4_10_14_0_8_um_filter_32_14 TaxID=1974640 RepID=A0A2M7RA58_9BACT|nr:MAG: AAA family ATPase [Candidatus Magasanikbacteria bacterium CG_4_10_14_0_8_um_filter_32_14]